MYSKDAGLHINLSTTPMSKSLTGFVIKTVFRSGHPWKLDFSIKPCSASDTFTFLHSFYMWAYCDCVSDSGLSQMHMTYMSILWRHRRRTKPSAIRCGCLTFRCIACVCILSWYTPFKYGFACNPAMALRARGYVEEKEWTLTRVPQMST